MKKTLVAAIVGLATACSVFAQGRINLDTYNTSPYPQITYGDSSIGTIGSPIALAGGWTIGVYYAAGNVSVTADPSGFADPSTLGLTLGSGLGSTTTLVADGWFASTADFAVPGVDGVAQSQATIMVVAYNGADYATSTVRGHSQAFVLTPQQVGAAPGVGAFMSPFQVFTTTVVPEPSTFALAGLGLAGLLIFRRRK